MRKLWPNQCAAANRRPAGLSDGSGEFRRDGWRRSASPAAVAAPPEQATAEPVPEAVAASETPALPAAQPHC